jgi:hypothetical protein
VPKILTTYQHILWQALHSRYGVAVATEDAPALIEILGKARGEARRHGIMDFEALFFRASPHNSTRSKSAETQVWILRRRNPDAENPA